jgi:uncharacterized protein (TIGR01777 family)
VAVNDLPGRVAVSGATGLVGTALCADLRARGVEIVRLVRGAPGSGEAPIDAPGRVDAVVHLAGKPITGRWTAAHKADLRSSRIDHTARLASALAATCAPGTPFLSASAVGWYGNRLDPVDETEPCGTGFLAEMARDWEAATQAARTAGLRVVNVRVGMVLAPHGGLLGALLPPARLGLSGPLGAGTQGLSWIHIDDMVGALRFLLTSDLAGPVNGTAPQPVSQLDFARALGQTLGRPAFLPTPAFALRLALGQSSELVLEGQYAHPRRLLEAGYTFAWPSIGPALADLVGR